jgi:elongation factor Ts
MEVSASQVSALREKTGIGMMICKKALIESNGDMEKAIEYLRKQGQATLQKRAGKSAKEGTISIVSDSSSTIMYEVNAETDFVARNEDFIKLVSDLGAVLLAKKPASIEAAKALSLGTQTVEARLLELTGKIGELIGFRRMHLEKVNPASERVCSYLHGKRFGVFVKLSCEKSEVLDSDAVKNLGKELAMQIAAANPIAVSKDKIPATVMAKEREIYQTQAQNSGKPEKIWEKIIDGKVAKFCKEFCLVEQEYIRDSTIPVSARIEQTEKEISAKITVVSFLRWELGAEE